jgi:serine/threonine protein kinase
MEDADLLDQLLSQWEAARTKGNALSPEELCPHSPEIQQELREQMARLSDIDRVMGLSGDSASPQELPEVPEYEILEELGIGGMGRVFLARHRQLVGWEVAIKVLRPDRPLPQWFAKEAKTLAQLRHPHIVQIHAADIHRGEPYIVMDLMRGGNLAKRLEQFQAPVKAADLLQKVARAVHYVHENKILHRDLKPRNIFLDETGEPRVGDFGLAELLNEEPAGTLTGQPIWDMAETVPTAPNRAGTPPYMAPEQYRGDFGTVGRATDIWALGVVLYELLTRRRPFAGDLAGDLERAICETEPERPSDLVAAVPVWLDIACMRCLEKNPARRYLSAAALADDLQKHLGKPPGGWATARALTVVVMLCGALVGAFNLASSARPSLNSVQERYLPATEAVLQSLRRDQGADLVAQLQPEPRALWRAGTGRAKWYRNQSGAVRGITVDAVELSLIELLPEIPYENYRLTVELRQDSAYLALADVGVYFFHESEETPDGPRHLLMLARFADVGDSALIFQDANGRPCSRLQLMTYFVNVPSWPYPANDKSVLGHVNYDPRDAQQGPGNWHTMVVDVRGAEVRVLWDVDAISTRPAEVSKDLVRDMQKKFPSTRRPNWQLRRRGGVGIYLNRSAATVQRFVVEPLTDP